MAVLASRRRSSSSSWLLSDFLIAENVVPTNHVMTAYRTDDSKARERATLVRERVLRLEYVMLFASCLSCQTDRIKRGGKEIERVKLTSKNQI